MSSAKLSVQDTVSWRRSSTADLQCLRPSIQGIKGSLLAREVTWL